MKEIQLSQGKVALVDDEDFEFLNQWKWKAQLIRNIYYAVNRSSKQINYKRKFKGVYMHRLIMENPLIGEIDHINHNGLDNRRINLRICSHRENIINAKRGNKHGYPGIKKDYNKYYAIININGKNIYLGSSCDPTIASKLYTDKVYEIESLQRSLYIKIKSK